LRGRESTRKDGAPALELRAGACRQVGTQGRMRMTRERELVPRRPEHTSNSVKRTIPTGTG